MRIIKITGKNLRQFQALTIAFPVGTRPDVLGALGLNRYGNPYILLDTVPYFTMGSLKFYRFADVAAALRVKSDDTGNPRTKSRIRFRQQARMLDEAVTSRYIRDRIKKLLNEKKVSARIFRRDRDKLVVLSTLKEIPLGIQRIRPPPEHGREEYVYADLLAKSVVT